ncbi:hypothetical protein PZE06_02810 [Robertmurraya sp. DFI.2.37]|uniref:hypothetical protein n=1 Tax=Robertmurraya sp. DFI.2.37 TaxID=3031819 RepID=UPI001246D91C|nr:hypothetical protein [Robertmurraya sp. DFI.2.37]MDF1507108.1 hypothetical protein [Robertmurraya sp. DFI.2.37]
MFQAFFAAELARRVGTRVEIGLTDRLVEGVLSSVSGELALVVETTSYTPSVTTAIPLSAIVFVRIPATAA